MEAVCGPCGVGILRDYPLSRLSFVGTAGRARMVIFPETLEDMVEAIGFLQKEGIPYVVCGASSNILWGDGYFDGAVVVTIRLCGVSVQDTLVVCEAGVSIAALLNILKDCGLTGAEELYGIPGTVGGAVVMNAGAFGKSIGDFVEAVECLVDGERVLLKRNEITFSYRTSSLKGVEVLKIQLRFSRGSFDYNTLRKAASERKKRFPSGRSLGSVFKNPFPFYAGRLIEEAGLRGYSKGLVEVSSRHANFIVSSSDRALDYLELVNLVKERVFSHSGVLLEEEIVYAGSFV